MAYVFQSFTINQVHTAAQMNQTEVNIRDHKHGSSGVNAIFGTTASKVELGTGTGTATLVGVANVQFIQADNVGTAETNLHTYTLLANSLSADGKGIRVRAWGLFPSLAVGTKIARMRFGPSIIAQIDTTSTDGSRRWYFDAIVVRTGASAQLAIVLRMQGTTAISPAGIIDQTHTTPAASISGDIIVKTTGEGAEDGQTRALGFVVEFLN